MVSPGKLRHLYESVVQNISSAENPVRGDFVECGVWRGGATMMMLFAEQAALARRRKAPHRDVWLFDTFEGMTVPDERDGGRAAQRWNAVQAVSSSSHARTAGWSAQDFATGGDGGEYVDASGKVRWNYGPIDVVRQNVESTKYPPERVHYTKGKVEDTLTGPNQQLPKKIALLRLDTDWFNSTMAEFRILAPRLTAGALIIVDDYCTWQGARQATNEFLAKHRNHFFLQHQARTHTGRTAVLRDVEAGSPRSIKMIMCLTLEYMRLTGATPFLLHTLSRAKRLVAGSGQPVSRGARSPGAPSLGRMSRGLSAANGFAKALPVALLVLASRYYACVTCRSWVPC